MTERFRTMYRMQLRRQAFYFVENEKKESEFDIIKTSIEIV